MPSVNTTCRTNTCKPNDITLPPTPTVNQCIAFDRAANLRVVRNNNPGNGWSRRPDPAYIELGNVEAGAKIQIVNLSKNPEAGFENKKDIIDLDLTGRDIRGRRASVYLTNDDMNKIDLKAGDQLQIRVVDPQGNASAAVTAELEPNDWANAQVQVNRNGRWEGNRAPGAQFNALDGEGENKTLVVRAVADGREPLLLEDKLSVETLSFSDAEQTIAQCFLDHKDELTEKYANGPFSQDQLKDIAKDESYSAGLRDAAKKMSAKRLFEKFDAAVKVDDRVGYSDFEFAVAGKSRVDLKADRAIEPNSRVDVFNTRTGETFRGNVGADQKINVPLNADDGDTLIVRPFDNEGTAGKELEILYSATCSNGRAKTHNILGARLPGVI